MTVTLRQGKTVHSPDWKHYASMKLFELIEEGEPFTSPDLAKRLDGLDYPPGQLGNFFNSWRSKGAIRSVGAVFSKRHKKDIHLWKGVQVSDVTRYQVMPPLSPEEYQSLYDDIKANGVHTPIFIDEEGVIIDGHHRSKIARELGIPCPVITHDGLDEARKKALAYSSNLKRRHLSQDARRELIAESVRLAPIKRDSEHARDMGVDRKTVKRIRADEGIPTPDEVIREYVGAHPGKSNREVAADLGVDDKTVGKIRSAEKRDIPEFPHPAPEPDHTPPAPGLNPGDLDELNTPRPADKPTPEPKEETTTQYTMRGKSNQKQQIRAAERLAIQLESITVALDHEFPVRVFDRTFTKENAAELAEALQRSARELKIHATRLTEYAQGA